MKTYEIKQEDLKIAMAAFACTHLNDCGIESGEEMFGSVLDSYSKHKKDIEESLKRHEV